MRNHTQEKMKSLVSIASNWRHPKEKPLVQLLGGRDQGLLLAAVAVAAEAIGLRIDLGATQHH
jgi:hypothetical protein